MKSRVINKVFASPLHFSFFLPWFSDGIFPLSSWKTIFQGLVHIFGHRKGREEGSEWSVWQRAQRVRSHWTRIWCRAATSSLCALGIAFHTERAPSREGEKSMTCFLQQRITCSFCHLSALCPWASYLTSQSFIILLAAKDNVTFLEGTAMRIWNQEYTMFHAR